MDDPVDEFYEDYGANALDVPLPDLPFSDEQYRRDALYSLAEIVKYFGPRIDKALLSAGAKRKLTDFVATHFTRNTLLGHNKSVSAVMEVFRRELIELKVGFTPRDVRILDYASLMAGFEDDYENLISRTIGGQIIRERMLQHGQHITQEVRQVVAAPPQPVKEPRNNLLEI